MAHFNSITEQKMRLKQKLLQNQSIVNLLVNTGDNMAEFTDYKTGSKSPAARLIKTHFYVPGTTTDDKNFITMRSRIVRADNNAVKETAVIVFVICNEDQIDLLQGSRADLIANEIDQILNNGDDTLFGYGDIRIGTAEEVQFAENFSGWQIPYVTHEMNRKAALL